ncbi:hypothetical protein BDQ17DRAFT_1338551 [Cyathus striatus]|nr:hypothetical protein BDQ17DRAFT_1338551 [Cyathus striatus]
MMPAGFYKVDILLRGWNDLMYNVRRMCEAIREHVERGADREYIVLEQLVEILGYILGAQIDLDEEPSLAGRVFEVDDDILRFISTFLMQSVGIRGREVLIARGLVMVGAVMSIRQLEDVAMGEINILHAQVEEQG